MSRLTAIPLVLSVLLAITPAGAEIPVREEVLSVTTEEGIILNGVVVLPDEPDGTPVVRRPVVLLLHDLTRDRDSVMRVADALVARGMIPVAMDMRGHGHSQKTVNKTFYSFQVRPHGELHRVIADQRLILGELRKRADVDVTRVGMLGIGHGALMAAETAARFPEVKALVLVDTIQPVAGFRPDKDLGLYGGRAALIVTSSLPQSKERGLALAKYGGGERRVLTSEAFENLDRLLLPGSAALLDTTNWMGTVLGAKPPVEQAP